MAFEKLAGQDKAILDAILLEKKRQNTNIELIASENFVSEAVMEAQGSYLTNKYAEGYPGKRYYGGCEHVDVVEDIARDRAKELFGAAYVNVQPHSGAQANMAVYHTVLKPGDTVLGMNLSHGGHLTHGSPVNFSGILYNFVEYGVTADTNVIDYEDVRQKALESKPKLIVAGASAYPRAIDFAKFREIADEVGAYLMVDMAHIAGLVAAGLHESPIPYADITTSTTHKTLRGPRGGMILCKEQYAKLIFHSRVTMQEFKEVCEKEKVTYNLDKWLELSISFNGEEEVAQWLYIKGRNADTLFTLTKYPEDDDYKLDIQIREKEPQK